MIDYYEILEVSQKASPEVIRGVYKILLHRYNLEHESEDQSEIQKLHNLNLAYDVLSAPDKREAYDHELNKARSALNEFAWTHGPDELATENVPKLSQVNSNQVSNSPSILSRLNWNKWGWTVSILAVVIVLISMVKPDPEQALRGQLAVKSEAEREKIELEAELKKTETDQQKTNPAENKTK
ncbi:DnaJ domain-containing protein [Methyloglobulus sp.]|uniref:J domain-containing protein n=1 Tax=Methyloglobulus sp. TaxID=2518622 RepID=UPI0032B824F6